MSKLKVSEIFYSIQGEGRYMGVPSVFLRTFGCNFTCSGFGLPAGQKTTELEPIVAQAKLYKDYKDLPLVSTGCDSYASWHPAFKHLSPMLTVDEVVERILNTLPNNQWGSAHLVITGGEPLLGWQRAYPELLGHPRMRDLTEITFETNGTQEISQEFGQYLLDWTQQGVINLGQEITSQRREITFSVSAKLSCSGESRDQAIRPETVVNYQKYGYTYLKFVVANDQDVEEAEAAYQEYLAAGFRGPVYLMPVGGVESVYSLNNRRVAELAMTRGWRYSDRLQVPLFKNEWGT